MRKALVVLATIALLSACAHREPTVQVTDPLSLGQHLDAVTSAHNSGHYDALRPHFAKNATIQLPASPRGSNVETYIQQVKLEPYTVKFDKQEFVYSIPGRATTRTALVATSPGRFSLREVVTIDWVLEEGTWKIARMAVADWPSIVGTWRRGGPRGEGSLELRILPGGSYVVYARDDYAVPAFRGSYTLEGNRITLTDSSANDSSQFSKEPGSYVFVRSANGVNLRKVEDGNPWRTARFDGDWNSSR